MQFFSNAYVENFHALHDQRKCDGKNGKEVSIIGMCQDDTNVDIDVQLKEAPLKCIGKKWLEFLSN